MALLQMNNLIILLQMNYLIILLQMKIPDHLNYLMALLLQMNWLIILKRGQKVWNVIQPFSLSYNCYQIADHCAEGFQWGLLCCLESAIRWRHKLLVFYTCSIHLNVYLTFVIRNLYGTDYHLLQFKKAFDKSKCTLYIVLLNVMLNYCLNIWLSLLQNLVATAQLFLKYHS